jgi:hypothetical protein
LTGLTLRGRIPFGQVLSLYAKNLVCKGVLRKIFPSYLCIFPVQKTKDQG